MNTPERFALCVYRDGTSDVVPVTDYLRALTGGDPGFSADLAAVTLSVRLDGRELLAHQLSLGPIEMLVPQLREAAERLDRGEIAVVRSGVMDAAEGIYLVFQPSGTDTAVSVALVEEWEHAGLFPLPAGSRQAGSLYAYIERQLPRMLAAARGYDYVLSGIKMPTTWLRDCMVREAAAGDRLRVHARIAAWP